MENIKLNGIIYTNQNIPTVDYLSYMDVIINSKGVPFIDRLRGIIQQEVKNESYLAARNFQCWENIFSFNYIYLSDPTGLSELRDRLLVDESRVISKLYDFYTNIRTIVPPKMIGQLKYNFIHHLTLDYQVDKKVIASLIDRFPFFEILPILSSIWWDAQFSDPILIVERP